MVSLLSKIKYSDDTLLVASRQATAGNITDPADTWLQLRSNTYKTRQSCEIM